MPAQLRRTVYLHLVSGVDSGGGRVQISNNRGRINGLTSQAKVFGICMHVDGILRPRLDGKLRAGKTPVGGQQVAITDTRGPGQTRPRGRQRGLPPRRPA